MAKYGSCRRGTDQKPQRRSPRDSGIWARICQTPTGRIAQPRPKARKDSADSQSAEPIPSPNLNPGCRTAWEIRRLLTPLLPPKVVGDHEREVALADTCTECDSCHQPLTIGRATCVTNATEHLHSDSKLCTEDLEKRLGTFA